MKTPATRAMTLIEVLVVILLIAVAAFMLLPLAGRTRARGTQTKALSNLKQISLALKLYAGDNDGLYPDQQLTGGKPNGKMVVNSNQAFAQLIPTYLQTEMPFYLPKSKWSPAPPDDKVDPEIKDVRTETLKKGENTWAIMTGINEKSETRWPLAADATNGKDTAYSADESDYGGVWKGKVAIIARNDQSVSLVRLDTDYKAKFSPTHADGLVYSAADNWLTATSALVNPDR